MAAVLALTGGALTVAGATVPTPEEYFGFRPGTDRKLVDYGQLSAYLTELAVASPRVMMEEVGRTVQGRPMYLVFISTEENLVRLDELKRINRRLALDPELPDDELDVLVEEGRVFLMAMLSMHSTEVAPAQALPLFAHEMATTEDPELLSKLAEVVLMVMPTHNPDGMDMVVEHYRSYLGTIHEGSYLPGIYHEYVGHDNNRDYITLTQPESRVVSRAFSTEWFPQVIVDKHQMGSTGPRYFVPEFHDPIAENIDEDLWYWSDVFGSNLARHMGADGLRGVASHWVFDEYWPGASSTSHWKGAITLLTEAASCRLATPVFVEPTELKVSGKGLAEYKKGVNMPDPWPGGWWRIGDIVRYELSSMHSLLATSAVYREDILRFRNRLCRSEVERGHTQAPYYFILPSDQHDRGALVELVRLMHEHGVEIHRLNAQVEVGQRLFAEGDIVISLAQPFRAFIKEVLELQRYPVRHYTPDGEIIRPYDITSWSLPLHWGLVSYQIDLRSDELESHLEAIQNGDADPAEGFDLPEETWGVAFDARANASYRAAFVALAKGMTVTRSRAGIEVDGNLLAPGSFVVRGDRTALLEVVEISPGAAKALFEEPSGEAVALRAPRVGLIETYHHDMDAGWTRYLLDSYGVRYQVVRPGDVAELDLTATFDVLVFPSSSTESLTKSRRKSGDDYFPIDFPPEFRRPITKAGLKKLAGFVKGGGVVISWGRSTELFLEGRPKGDEESEEYLDLPARDLSDELRDRGLYVPGAMLEVSLLPKHPVTWGMPETLGVFSRGEGVYTTSIPILDTDRRVIATHPEHDILLSGYIEGAKQLSEKPVMLWLRAGRGQLVLIGFNPIFRASTPVTYKLVFNALLLPPVGD
jgi:hypothetical protein